MQYHQYIRRQFGKRLFLAGASLVAVVTMWASIAACDLIGQPAASTIPHTVLKGNSATNPSVVFSPDGRWLASGGISLIKLWDMHNLKKQPIELRDPSASFSTVAFSPDGKWLASGHINRELQASGHTDGIVSLWRMDDLTAPPIEVKVNAFTVDSVVFSPDGRWLAVGGIGYLGVQIQLWEVQEFISHGSTAASVRLSGHTSNVNALAFSSDSQVLASGSEDGTVRLWNIQQPIARPTTVITSERGIKTLAFHPKGEMLAAGTDHATLHVLDMGQPDAEPTVLWLCTTTPPTPKFIDSDFVLLATAFSPDGQTLAAACGNKTVYLLDVRQPTSSPTVLTVHPGTPASLVFSPDGQILAVGTRVDIWLWEVGKAVPTPEP